MHTCQCVYICTLVGVPQRVWKEKKKRELRHADSSVLCTAVFIIALSVVATDSGSLQRKQAEEEGRSESTGAL